jgi:hypothetical protein
VFDPLSTQFSETQRESYQGVIGRPEYDRRTYEALLGDGSEPPAPRRRRVSAGLAALVVPALAVAGLLGALAYWLAQFLI